MPIFQILGVIMFIGFIILGIGLIKLSNLARIIVIIFYALMIVLDLVMLLTGIFKFDIGILIRTIIEIIVIIYLNKPDVKSVFH